MFAIVEFENKEIALVPLVWVTDLKRKCYWPNIRTQNQLDKLVQLAAIPKTTWKLYTLKRILYSSRSYTDCEKRLEAYLNDEITSGEFESSPLTLKSITDCDETSASNENEYLNTDTDFEQDKKRRKVDVISNVQLNDWNIPNFIETPQKIEKVSETVLANDPNHNFNHDVTELIHGSTPPRVQQDLSISSAHGKETSLASTRTISHQSTPITSLRSTPVVENPAPPYAEALIRDMAHIKSLLDQHAIMLDEILRTLGSRGASALEAPETIPVMPIKSYEDFKTLDALMATQKNYNYLVRRFAAIGGPNVRTVTMNILKFLLKDEVAILFNWAGRDGKNAFKTSIIAGIIFAAVKLTFSGREPADLQDSTIKSAIQDWLKLAPQRHKYSLRKQQ